MGIWHAGEEASTPASPSAGNRILYPKSDGWYQKDSAGAETKMAVASDITLTSLGIPNVENKSSATIRGEITSGNVTGALGFTPANAAAKDASGGYAGLTLFKLNLRNAADTITSWFTTAATAARTWTMPNKDGIVAMTSDITGGTSAGAFTNLSATGSTTFSGLTNRLGYNAGGSVTQASAKTDAVTLNAPCGQITMDADALAAGAQVAFNFTNSYISYNTLIMIGLAHDSGGISAAKYSVRASAGNGTASVIVLKNETAGSLSEAVVLEFMLFDVANS